MWSKQLLGRVKGNDFHISVVFTWQLPKAAEEIKKGRFLGYHVVCGGPAVRLMPEYLPSENVCLADDGDWLRRHNTEATRTSQGCPRNCAFCAVPRLHERKEFSAFRPGPILCDDNFLACSKKHIERSVRRLLGIPNIDFNQGLDARLLNNWRLNQLLRLKMKVVRFAWDGAQDEQPVMRAVERCRAKGVPKQRIRCYVLIAHNETPEEALYRCETLKAKGVWPTPMRYQPLNALKKNSTHGLWEERALLDFVHYWSRLRWLEHIPFSEYKR